MSYYDQAITSLKSSNPDNIAEFQRVYALGKEKILSSDRLFRLMSPPEAEAWDRVGPASATHLNRALMNTLFHGGGGYTSKWFTFDRPYRFGRQTINEPGGREGQGILMTIVLTPEIKNTLLKTMLADTILHGVPQELKSDSCRCKAEGGTITLGVSLPVLEKIAHNMTIEHLGARLTPPAADSLSKLKPVPPSGLRRT